MLDFFNVPSNQQDRQIFYATTGSNTWQTWRKPRGAKMVHMFCLGGGGGGAGGSATVFGTACAGSSGGGASSYSTGLFPAFLLPDILYVRVGIGGRGSLGITVTTNTRNDSSGSTGLTSSISLTPSISASSLILASGNTAGGGGAGAASLTGGGVGGAGTKWVYTNSAIPSSLGLISSFDGVPGTSGSNSANAVSLNALSQSIVTGGCGGGGRAGNNTTYNGGSIQAANIYLLSSVAGGLGFNDNNGGNGVDGYGILSPVFCGTGGAGGGTTGATSNVRGGNGGNGFFGCGGGAGGSAPAVSSNTTGNGGRGGDGIVIITTIF